jgi:hypothetical protein
MVKGRWKTIEAGDNEILEALKRRTQMPRAKEHASAILRELQRAEAELIGKAVVLTDGKAGTVEQVVLDEVHGLRVSIAGHPGKWPVSTIKLLQK